MDVWNTIISANAGNVPQTIHASVHHVNGRANGLHPTFLITVSLLSALPLLKLRYSFQAHVMTVFHNTAPRSECLVTSD